MRTKHQIIDETVKAYKLSTRAENEDGGCVYWIDGRMCAVGRCMRDPKAIAESFDEYESTGVESVHEQHDLGTLLKPRYRGHEIDFWIDLQHLHDIPNNWGAGGISEQGKQKVEELKEKWPDT